MLDVMLMRIKMEDASRKIRHAARDKDVTLQEKMLLRMEDKALSVRVTQQAAAVATSAAERYAQMRVAAGAAVLLACCKKKRQKIRHVDDDDYDG